MLPLQRLFTFRPSFPSQYHHLPARPFHPSLRTSKINRQAIEDAPNSYLYMDPVFENPDTKARFAKCTEIISDIRALADPTEKEREVEQFARMHRASILRTMKKYGLAKEELYRIEAMGISSPFLCGEFGKELTLMGQYGLALRFFSRCIMGLPAGSNEALIALEGRAGCLFEQQQIAKQENPKAVEYHKELIEAARKDIEEALFHCPEHIGRRLEKGKIYSEIDTKVAIKELNYVVEVARDSESKGEALLRLISIHLRLNNTKTVLALRDRLVELDPDHPRALMVKKLVSFIEVSNEQKEKDLQAKKKVLEKEMNKEALEKFYKYYGQNKKPEEIKELIAKDLEKYIRKPKIEE